MFVHPLFVVRKLYFQEVIFRRLLRDEYLESFLGVILEIGHESNPFHNNVPF